MEESEKNKALAKRHQLTKKERNLLGRQQGEKERLRYHRQKKLKKILLVAVGVLIVGGGIFGGVFWATRTPLPESEVISEQGIHWHTELSITILGQKQDIPANIGISITEQPIHTHEEDNIIHLEFTGVVKKDDIRLSRFFEIWDKNFSQGCIFDNCNGPEGTVKMFVNGKTNFEFENYIMRDGDKIEIIFE